MTNEKPNHYSSAINFERALNDKLRSMGQVNEILDLPRLRRHIAFERFLIRIFNKTPSPWVLKGGFAMELRIDQARATKDIDLGFGDLSYRNKKREIQSEELLEQIRNLASQDLGDFFQFYVSQPTHALLGTPFGGTRFSIEARLAAKTFSKFHLDVAVGETMLEPLDMLAGKNWLKFAGLSSTTFPTLSREQQFAEKFMPTPDPVKKVRVPEFGTLSICFYSSP